MNYLDNLPSKNFCPAPFLHGQINANNRALKLCCMSEKVGKFDGLSDLQAQYKKFWLGDTMKKAREQFLRGEWPEPCNYCKIHEEKGALAESSRIHFLKKFHNELNYDELNLNAETGNKYEFPIDIDLRPGKLCNLKCRSCNTVWSNQIEKEVLANIQIQGKEWYWDTITHSPSHLRLVKSINWEDPSFDIISGLDMHNVKWLKISGGETLVDDRVYLVLKKIIDADHAKDIELHIVTNCTVFPEKFFNVISLFKKVTVNASLDASDKLEEYLRTGVIWDKQVSTFAKLSTIPNLSWLGINSLVQVTNMFNFEYWFDKITQMGTKCAGSKFNGVHLMPLVDPMYLCIAWLDDDHKDLIRGQLSNLRVKYNDSPKILEELKIVDVELNREVDKEFLQKEYVRHTRALDNIRHTNVLDVTPELKRYFNG